MYKMSEPLLLKSKYKAFLIADQKNSFPNKTIVDNVVYWLSLNFYIK